MLKRAFLPPADALVAFEAAARHESFTRAAEELHLTQGAVSKQIRHLEQRLGVALFSRVRQRVLLTDAGRLYLHEVRGALDHLHDATRQVMSFAGSQDVLNLAVLPTFGTRWLAPRLADFLRQTPQAALNISIRLRPFDFEQEPFDGAIHHGDPLWAGGIVEPLFPEETIVVCSRPFRDRHLLAKPADLLRVPRLQLATRPMAWRDWFEANRLVTDTAFQGPRFEQFGMIAEAAAHHLGVAIMPVFFVEDELASGRLVKLFDGTVAERSAYHFVYPENRALRPVVSAFRRWLTAEAKTARISRESLLPG